MFAVNKRYNGIQILRAVLFIDIVAFHSGVPGSQMLCVGDRYSLLLFLFLDKEAL